MEQYFKEFEEKLQVTEEKLDILSEWHIAKEHNGAAEIAEECRGSYHKSLERISQAIRCLQRG